MYITIKTKFILTCIITVTWLIICTFIQAPWYSQLVARFGYIIATVIVVGLAYLPGIMISLSLCGLILDKPRRKPVVEEDLEDITILIAAYNEEAGIYDTIKSLAAQDYPKKLIIKVIDNNSKDNTKGEIYRAINDFPQLQIEYLFESVQGKFAALNQGLFDTTTRFVLTIDADTYLYKDALKYITNTMVQENKNKEVAAVAGTVLVRNSRDNLLAAMQEWEYFLSITCIKRAQGLFQTVLVAQGAFSIYDTKKVQAIGGWKDSIGEDIVVTWELLSNGNRTYYEDRAIAFTNAPTEFKIFSRQRARWARGMIEGFRHFSFKKCNNFYSKVFIFADLFLFLIDFSVTFIYIPGLIACIFFHDYLIVGPMTFILYPITFFIFGIMFLSEQNRVFKELGLKVRKHYLAFLAFTFTYSLIMSPVCIKGYIQEFFKTKRKWR